MLGLWRQKTKGAGYLGGENLRAKLKLFISVNMYERKIKSQD